MVHLLVGNTKEMKKGDLSSSQPGLHEALSTNKQMSKRRHSLQYVEL